MKNSEDFHEEFVRLGREISSLSKQEKSLVKARVETEKQYFKRVIDEKAFRKILVEGQAKILRVRGSLKTKRESRKALLKERLNPFSKKKKKGELSEQGVSFLSNVLHNSGFQKRDFSKSHKKEFWKRKKKAF